MKAPAIWRGHGWREPTLRRVRIKKGVRPYGGRLADLVREDGDRVTLWIQPAERQYRRDEIEELA